MASPKKPSAPQDVTVTAAQMAPRPSQKELAIPPPTGAKPDARMNQLLELWAVLTRARTWRSLAVVPVPGSSALATAQAIAEAANLLRSRPIQVMNAEGLDPSQVESWIRELRSWVKREERVMVVLSPVVSHPAGLPLAHAADAALLCVPLNSSGFAGAHKTVELVGRGHFLGTVTIKAGKAGKAK